LKNGFLRFFSECQTDYASIKAKLERKDCSSKIY